LLAPGVQLHQLIVLEGPWRGAALEVDLAACVTVRAVKGSATAVGRATTSALLAPLVASAGAIAAVNADFFSFTPPGVPSGAHVEQGEVPAGPVDRPVVAVDADGQVRLTTLRAGGALTTAHDALPLGAWNRWPAAGLALLDERWGVPLDSGAAAGALAAVPLHVEGASMPRYRVLGRLGAPVALGDTVLLLADGDDTAAVSRSAATLLAALRPGDTVALTRSLAPFHPLEVVGAFPWSVVDSALAPELSAAGAESFRG
jgi:hypothetical protein